MRIIARVFCLVLVLAGCLLGGDEAAAQSDQDRKIALVGGMLLDGYEADPIHHAVVLVRGDSIAAVGTESELEVPDDYEVVDTSGKTMLPGLIDLHVHLTVLGHGSYEEWFPIFEEHPREVMEISARQLLLAGVTTAADMGGPPGILDLRDRIASGEVPGPRMHVSGPWITRVPLDVLPASFQHVVDSPSEAAERARELTDSGVDLIKTWVGMREEDIRAVAEVAHEAGIDVHSHLYREEAIWEAVRGGTDVIQHAGSAGEMPYSQELLRELAYRDVPVVPTMAHRIWVLPATLAFPERLEDPRLKADFPAFIYEAVQESFEEPHRLGYFHTTARQIRYAEQGAASQLIDANLVVAMGTDSGTPANFHTEAAWREISAMVESGMSPIQAISASTRIPAEVLGVADEVGTVEPGKKADILIVEGNPLFDINVLGYVDRVVKGGKIYRR